MGGEKRMGVKARPERGDEEEAGQRRRQGRESGQGREERAQTLAEGSTCWRLLLQTQCCQPPSAPLESRQEVQLGRR